MLKRDDELRLSDSTQRAYGRCDDGGYEAVRITEAVQRAVCREFGFESNIEEGLEVMRCAMAMFPGDEEVRDACHYLRHNIHVPCPILVGSQIPDVSVLRQDGSVEGLHALCDAFPAGPTLILAGSIT